MPLDYDAVRRMTPQARQDIVCKLSLFPALTKDEIAEYMTYTPVSIYKFYLAGKKRGVPAAEDFTSKRKSDPNGQEMLWRFRNQNPEQIIKRFGHRTWNLVEKLRLVSKAPVMLIKAGKEERLPELGDKEEQEDTPRLVQVRDRRYCLEGTDFEFTVEDPRHDLPVVERLVGSFREQYDIPDDGWVHIEPIIRIHVEADRHWREATADEKGDTKWLAEQTSLQKNIAELIKRLPFPEKTGEDEYALILRAVDSAPEYFEEHGWKQTMICPRCGTYVSGYFTVYRAVMEFYNLCKTLATQRIPSLATPERVAELAQAIVNQVDEHPYLKFQIRELGMQWSLPLMRWAEQMIKNHPEVVESYVERGHNPQSAVHAFFAEIGEVLAEMMGLGPVIFDKSNPYSPLNRVKVANDGSVTILDPETDDQDVSGVESAESQEGLPVG